MAKYVPHSANEFFFLSALKGGIRPEEGLLPERHSIPLSAATTTPIKSLPLLIICGPSVNIPCPAFVVLLAETQRPNTERAISPGNQWSNTSRIDALQWFSFSFTLLATLIWLCVQSVEGFAFAGSSDSRLTWIETPFHLLPMDRKPSVKALKWHSSGSRFRPRNGAYARNG